MMFPQTFQPYLGWIQRRSLVQLLITGLGVYLFFTLLFSLLYAKLDCAVIRAQSTCDSAGGIEFWEYLFFSISIQSTLGSSSLTGYSKTGHLLVATQVLVGIVYGGVLIGAIFARFLMLNPQALRIDKTIGFDPKSGELAIRLVNLFNFSLYEVNIKLLAVRTRTGDKVLKRTQLELLAPTISMLDPKIPTNFRTKSAHPASTHVIPVSKYEDKGIPTRFSPQKMGPLMLSESETYEELLELRVTISASAPFGLIQRTMKFHRDAIRCGQHTRTSKSRLSGRYNFKNFDKFSETDYQNECGGCRWREDCGLSKKVFD